MALLVAAGQARTRPRYGDTLRVETETIVMSGDNTPDALVPLVFETLVTVDDSGHLRPGLATSWTSSNGGRRWDFSLRHDVVFQDGSRFDSSYVVECFSKLANQSWTARGSSGGVVFESATPQPNLPAILSLPQYAISFQGEGGTSVGTGPFDNTPRTGSQLTLKANDEYWGGRPYIDVLELQPSRSLREQANDFAFERADVVEMAPEQLRRVQQDRLRVEVSRPAETVFVVFDSSKPELRDVRLRQAISLCIDRAAIRNVIFQHQGEIASGLLPNWLSGYEFLFPAEQNLARARQLRMDVGQISQITIAYDAGDATGRLIAERIALNAHDIGLSMQAVPVTAGSPDLRLRRASLPSLDPDAALSGLLDALNVNPRAVSPAPRSTYQAEREVLDSYAILPLVHLPRATALKDRVHNWAASPDGEWHLEGVWLSPRNGRSEVHP